MRVGNFLAATFVGATAAALIAAGPASAAPDAPPPPAAATGGMVVIEPDSVGTLATTVNVGGGTWSYGTNYNSQGQKTCYSSYTHPTNRHTATAIIGADNTRVSASAGLWAHARSYGSAAQTCYAYWNNQ